MPAQLTLRSPKGGRVLAERTYADGHRIDAVSGWLVVVDRNGSVVAAHAACPGLEAALVEHTSAAAPYPAGETATYPTDDGIALDEDDESVEESVADPPLRVADMRDDGDRFAEELMLDLQRLGDTYGPLGVAIAAATLTDPQVLVREIVDTDPRRPDPGPARPEPAPPHDGCEEQADALRAEVARLSGLLAATHEADRADGYLRELAEVRDRLEREHASRLRAEREADAIRAERDEQFGEAQGRIAHLTAERIRLARRVDELEHAPALPSFARPLDGARVTAMPDPVPHEPIDLRPVEDDPRRPHADAWPDDAVLLTYRELRRLVALHLERYNADDGSARAVLDGDVPLRVSEVLT